MYSYTTYSEVLKEQLRFLFAISGAKINKGKTVLGISFPYKKERAKIYNNLYFTKIKKIEKVSNNSEVYDIEVEKNHNFFCENILVSNSIYPDCRPEFIDSMVQSIKLADWNEVELKAPYWNINKIDILKKGLELGVDYSLTHTCYNPNKAGESCGKCGSCRERLEAFEKNGIKDPLKYYDAV